MAVKTLTITTDAYNSIKNMKNPGESFSQLFLRLSKKKLTVNDLRGVIKISDKEYEALKKHTKEWRKKASKDIEERRKRCTF